MTLNKLFSLMDVSDQCTTKSVFGNTGVFYRGAMFAQVNGAVLLLRGCQVLDNVLLERGCPVYIQEKKRSISKMNYYDVSHILEQDEHCIREFVACSYEAAYQEQLAKQAGFMSRLRELPNLNHTIERMLIRCGVESVERLKVLGAAEAFHRLKSQYGAKTDIQLLWKLYGAIHGIHWQLVREEDKTQLLGLCALLN